MTYKIKGESNMSLEHSKFLQYFENVEQYPRKISIDILPWNELWTYVSEAILNAFINYVDIVDAYLMHRYNHPNDILDLEMTVYTTSYWSDPVKVNPQTKKEFYNLCTEKGRAFHTKLSCFDDDVIILAQPKMENKGKVKKYVDVVKNGKYTTLLLEEDDISNYNLFFFFWFDMDNSDCCIGRFLTKFPIETVRNDFKSYCFERCGRLSNGYLNEELEPWYLPNHFFEDWLKF